MNNDRKPLNEGYKPTGFEKGYQPSSPTNPGSLDKVNGGYQPVNQGGNPANNTPPGKE
jgi:hypothetical protein